MRGTRRRETGIHEWSDLDPLQHVTPVRHLRLRAVEEDVCDVRVQTEEGREIVRHLRVPLDTRIEAALPAARLKHIPQRNSIRQERLHLGLIRGRDVERKQRRHDFPVGFVGMRWGAAGRRGRGGGRAAGGGGRGGGGGGGGGAAAGGGRGGN